jgi:hypothetical protein
MSAEGVAVQTKRPVTQPTVRFVCGGETVNMAAGECWIFDTWREHNVFNDASEHRIYLVADSVGGAEFSSLVERGRPHAAALPGWSPRLFRAWRGLWARFGDSGEGGAEYRHALQRFMDEVPEGAMRKPLRNGSLWLHAVTSAALKPALRADHGQA